jgi:hypothetical protein
MRGVSSSPGADENSKRDEYLGLRKNAREEAGGKTETRARRNGEDARRQAGRGGARSCSSRRISVAIQFGRDGC